MQTLDEVYKIQNAHSGYCYGLADFGSVVWTFGWDKRICLWDTKVLAAPSSSPPLPRACQTTVEAHPLALFRLADLQKPGRAAAVPRRRHQAGGRGVGPQDHQLAGLVPHLLSRSISLSFSYFNNKNCFLCF